MKVRRQRPARGVLARFEITYFFLPGIHWPPCAPAKLPLNSSHGLARKLRSSARGSEESSQPGMITKISEFVMELSITSLCLDPLHYPAVRNTARCKQVALCVLGSHQRSFALPSAASACKQLKATSQSRRSNGWVASLALVYNYTATADYDSKRAYTTPTAQSWTTAWCMVPQHGISYGGAPGCCPDLPLVLVLVLRSIAPILAAECNRLVTGYQWLPCGRDGRIRHRSIVTTRRTYIRHRSRDSGARPFVLQCGRGELHPRLDTRNVFKALGGDEGLVPLYRTGQMKTSTIPFILCLPWRQNPPFKRRVEHDRSRLVIDSTCT
ncbi:hypothetical protein FB451DRAFT_1368070 [Mycena latifolia]|nr:hypothetical protein FB451DRAFT_1368070 [Mycena latifolia]